MSFWKNGFSGKLPGTAVRKETGVKGASFPPLYMPSRSASSASDSSSESVGSSSSKGPLDQGGAVGREVSASSGGAAVGGDKPVEGLKLKRLRKMLAEPQVNMDQLRKASWSGVPYQVRATVWQLLLGYLPANRERRTQTIDRRRREYQTYLGEYYSIGDSRRTESENVIMRQIGVDVPRTSPGITWIQHPRLQASLNRMLYIWAIRHPASGYVQGINDLATPFYLVSLSELASLPLDADFEPVVDGMSEVLIILMIF
jgi:hypothetical protein